MRPRHARSGPPGAEPLGPRSCGAGGRRSARPRLRTALSRRLLKLPWGGSLSDPRPVAEKKPGLLGVALDVASRSAWESTRRRCRRSRSAANASTDRFTPSGPPRRVGPHDLGGLGQRARPRRRARPPFGCSCAGPAASRGKRRVEDGLGLAPYGAHVVHGCAAVAQQRDAPGASRPAADRRSHIALLVKLLRRVDQRRHVERGDSRSAQRAASAPRAGPGATSPPARWGGAAPSPSRTATPSFISTMPARMALGDSGRTTSFLRFMPPATIIERPGEEGPAIRWAPAPEQDCRSRRRPLLRGRGSRRTTGNGCVGADSARRRGRSFT